MALTLVGKLDIFPGMNSFLPANAPDLGLACLAGACGRAGHEVAVYDLPGRLLHIAFADCAEEIAEAAAQSRAGASKVQIIRDILEEKGLAGLARHLQRNYMFATDPGEAGFIDGGKIKELGRTIEAVFTLYSEYSIKKSASSVLLLEKLSDEIQQIGSDSIGFSVNLDSIDFMARLIMRCREKTGSNIIVGGRSTFGIESDEDSKELMRRLGADCLIKGYADETLPMLLDAEFNFNSAKNIPNAVCVLGDEIITGPERDDFKLSEFPAADYTGFNLDRYFFPSRMLVVQTARGCGWKKCAFCRLGVCQKGYYEFSPEESADRIIQQSDKWNVKYFCIGNECLRPAQALRISQRLIESGANIKIMAGARPDNGFDEETLRTMSLAGFKTIFWGVESGAQSILDAVGKGTSVDGNERLLIRSFESGISNLCFFIAGFPGDTEETFAETLRFIKKNRKFIDYARLNPFKLFSDTRIFQRPEDYGVEIGKRENNGEACEYFVKKGLTAQQAESIVSAVIEKMNSNGKAFFNGRFFNPETAARGDEKIAFFFWQACGNAADSQE